jgi:hypothetical protein
MHFSKETIYLKHQLAPTCFGASGTSPSGSPKWSCRTCVYATSFYCVYCFYYVTSLIKILTTDKTFLYILTVYILVLFLAYYVAHTQFRQDKFGIPENGAPKEPKHVGASWYFKYMVYFETWISLVFLSSYFENAWSNLQNHAHNLMRQFP